MIRIKSHPCDIGSMSGFIGRASELSTLSDFMDNPGVHGLVVYGIRQVGKSALLRNFAKGRRSVYVQLDRGSESAIVESAVSQIRSGGFAVEGEPRTISGLFDVFSAICLQEPTLIILDEYQYMSGSAPHADTMLQRFMDTVVKDTGSKVIICGSQISSLLDAVENSGNPLYMRFRMSLEVLLMPFRDACEFHPGMGDRDLVSMYMILGGMPGDHLQFVGPTFKEAVSRALLGRGLPFRNAARGRIGSELGNTDENVAIVRALAKGRHSLREIAEYVGIPESTCLVRLSKLEELGVVGRRHPMCGAPKRASYVIADGLVGLWYSVFNDLIESELPEDIGKRYDILGNRVETYLGKRFETFCAQWMARRYSCLEIGSWWGTEVNEDGIREGADIDIVARITEEGKRATVFCECKYRDRPAKARDLEVLERRARVLDGTGNLVIFSAGGFERELTAMAEDTGATLIGLDVLMGRAPAPRLLTSERA